MAKSDGFIAHGSNLEFQPIGQHSVVIVEERDEFCPSASDADISSHGHTALTLSDDMYPGVVTFDIRKVVPAPIKDDDKFPVFECLRLHRSDGFS